MPYKIIMEEILDEMLDSISYIKLNTYINLQKEDQSSFFEVKILKQFSFLYREITC